MQSCKSCFVGLKITLRCFIQSFLKEFANPNAEIEGERLLICDVRGVCAYTLPFVYMLCLLQVENP